jgi:hypothetical protein
MLAGLLGPYLAVLLGMYSASELGVDRCAKLRQDRHSGGKIRPASGASAGMRSPNLSSELRGRTGAGKEMISTNRL